MAKKTESRKASGTGRGNVPTGYAGVKITVNMGNFNSVGIDVGLSNIDVSSKEAALRELEDAGPALFEIAAVVDNKTGVLLESVIGTDAADDFHMRMLQAIVASMDKAGKK